METLCIHKEKSIKQWINYFDFTVPQIKTPSQASELISQVSQLYNEATQYYLVTKADFVDQEQASKANDANLHAEVMSELSNSDDVKNGKMKLTPTTIKAAKLAKSAGSRKIVECIEFEKEFWYDICQRLKIQMDLLKQGTIAYSYNKELLKDLKL